MRARSDRSSIAITTAAESGSLWRGNTRCEPRDGRTPRLLSSLTTAPYRTLGASLRRRLRQDFADDERITGQDHRGSAGARLG